MAHIATFTMGEGKVLVAVDSTKADGPMPGVVRFDFTGKGQFKDAPSVPMRRGEDPVGQWRTGAMLAGQYYCFGPAVVKVSRGGKTTPVAVMGRYFIPEGDKNGSRVRSSAVGTPRQWMALTMAGATEGTCRFGKLMCSVRVIDCNGNFRFGDGLGVSQKGGQVVFAGEKGRWRTADLVALDTGTRTFEKADLWVKCGQLALVRGDLYRVTVSRDGLKMTAEPAGVKVGRIQIPADKWSVTLVGTKNVLELSGGRDPVEIPADQYVAGRFDASITSDIASKPYRVRSGYSVLVGRGKWKAFDVRPGAVTKIPLGSPFSATVKVSQTAETVRLSAVVRDGTGGQVSYLYGPKGRPPAPKVIVYNDRREQVYATSLKYG